MPKFVSLSLRDALFAQSSGDTGIVLATIDHDDLDAPIRLSSDSTQRITTDPLVYGTVSNGQTYYFSLMTAVLPHDEEERPIGVSLVFENVTSDIVSQIRSILTPIEVDLSLVMSSAPDTVEMQFTDLFSTKFSWNSGTLTLDISREPLISEPWPCHRKIKQWYPGLYK